jgi:hypothetical protein
VTCGVIFGVGALKTGESVLDISGESWSIEVNAILLNPPTVAQHSYDSLTVISMIIIIIIIICH